MADSNKTSPEIPEGVLVVKTTVNLPVTVVESLRKLAKERHTTLGKVISDAISLESYVQETVRKGGRVVIEESDNTKTRVWIR